MRKNSVIVQCAHCGADILRYPYQIKARDRHFCNNNCFAEYLKTLTGPAAPCYKAVTVPCRTCGKDIQQPPHHIKTHKNHFCSRECHHAFKASISITVRCHTCGKEFSRQPSHARKVKHHFCGFECEAEWLKRVATGVNNPNWKGGAAKYYGPTWNKQMRAARKRDGYCCQACGISQKKHGRSLDVHHIVPFKTFNYIPGENESHLQANALDNLISLCRSCHTKMELGNLYIWRPTP